MNRSRSLALLAGAPLVTVRPAGAQTPASLRIVLIPGDAVKAVYYGIRAGIFQANGLELHVSVVPTGTAAAAGVIGGAADIGYTNVVTLITANRKRIPLRIVSPSAWVTAERPNVGLYVLKDSPIRTGRDLTAKTVGTPALGDLLWVGTVGWIDRSGGDSKSVRMIEVGASSAVPLLEQGRVDAVAMNEPFGSQAVESGKVRVLGRPMEAVAMQFEGGAYVALEGVIAQNPDAMARFAHGFHDASAYTNSHLAQTVELVASYTGATAETVAKMARISDPEFADPRNLQPVIDILARYGVIDKAFHAESLISSVALKSPRRRR